MSRPLRIQFSGALYHVISRGNERQRIVRDDMDRRRRLEWLQETVVRYGWRLHAFVLMSNHDHLFVETPQSNLSLGMKLLNGAYTQYFNSRHFRVGHLFQGRYKAHLVEDVGYYAELSRYIHLNPVRALMDPPIREPADYGWSSFRGYIRTSQRFPWVTYDRVLKDFGPGDEKVRCRRYASFVRAGIDKELFRPWSKAKEGFLIGSDEFLGRIKKILPSSGEPQGIPQYRQLSDRPPICEIIEAVCDYVGEDCSTWGRGRRSNNSGRRLAAFLCHAVYRYSLKEVALSLYYVNGSSVSSICRRVGEDRQLQVIAQDIIKKLKQTSDLIC